MTNVIFAKTSETSKTYQAEQKTPSKNGESNFLRLYVAGYNKFEKIKTHHSLSGICSKINNSSGGIFITIQQVCRKQKQKLIE